MKTLFDAGGEVLVVSGGAQGIGAAVAHRFVEAGGTSVVLDVAAPEHPHPGVEYWTVDVSDRAAVHGAIDAVAERYGRIDGLVAGAAVQPRVDVVDTTEELWRHTLGVNLDGVVWCAQAVLRHMIPAHRGSILVFASGLAHMGRAQASAYAASKGALISFAKSLAAEVVQHRIKVNTVFPGVIDTAQFRAANPTGGERDHWERTTGVGTADDVAGPLMFLLSDEATMTGSTLTRDRAYPSEER